jgi:hypothetical protein
MTGRPLETGGPLRLGHVLDSYRIAAAARSNGPPEPLFSRGFALWR